MVTRFQRTGILVQIHQHSWKRNILPELVEQNYVLAVVPIKTVFLAHHGAVDIIQSVFLQDTVCLPYAGFTLYI